MGRKQVTASFDSKNVSRGLFKFFFISLTNIATDSRSTFSAATVSFTKTALHHGFLKTLRTNFSVVIFEITLNEIYLRDCFSCQEN